MSMFEEVNTNYLVTTTKIPPLSEGFFLLGWIMVIAGSVKP